MFSRYLGSLAEMGSANKSLNYSTIREIFIFYAREKEQLQPSAHLYGRILEAIGRNKKAQRKALDL